MNKLGTVRVRLTKHEEFHIVRTILRIEDEKLQISEDFTS